MPYKVMIDDNFHYMDDDERYTHSTYATLEEAIAKCKTLVDVYLKGIYKQGMTADEMFKHYKSFGEDPWISGIEDVPFSAWAYAKQRCAEICDAAGSSASKVSEG